MKKKQANKNNSLGKVVHRPLWLLWFGFIVRAAHQIGAAVFLCSYLLPEVVAIPKFYLWLAVISGGILFVTEALRHREIYREVAGAITFLKLLLLGAVFHNLLPTSETVIVTFIFASIGAHLPKNIRHRILL